MKMKGMLDRLIDNESMLFSIAFVLIISIVSFSEYMYIKKMVVITFVLVAVGIAVVFGLVLIVLLYKKQEPEQEKISLTIETMTGVDTARFEMKRTELRIKASMDNNDWSIIKELTVEEWIEKYS